MPPDDGEVWDVSNVRAQYEPYPDDVATVRERADAAGSGFRYETREHEPRANRRAGNRDRRRPLRRRVASPTRYYLYRNQLPGSRFWFGIVRFHMLLRAGSVFHRNGIRRSRRRLRPVSGD